jgi:hypothetical protein
MAVDLCRYTMSSPWRRGMVSRIRPDGFMLRPIVFFRSGVEWSPLRRAICYLTDRQSSGDEGGMPRSSHWRTRRRPSPLSSGRRPPDGRGYVFVAPKVGTGPMKLLAQPSAKGPVLRSLTQPEEQAHRTPASSRRQSPSTALVVPSALRSRTR